MEYENLIGLLARTIVRYSTPIWIQYACTLLALLFKVLDYKNGPITGRASLCFALALSILLSILAHLSSSLSCALFFLSGSHPNYISYQVTNALFVSHGLLFLTTFSFPLVVFFLLLALSFLRLILSLSFLILQSLKPCLLLSFLISK